MRVLLKLVLDCEPDAAWLAIRSPRVFREVSWPFTTFSSLEDGGFPDVWPEGEHRVEVRALGVVPMGVQVIRVSFPSSASGNDHVRMMRDSGRGVSGPLAAITHWDHAMAVSAASSASATGTLYRDQLKFEAGPLTLLLWPVYWAFWQWRGIALRRLARRWAAAPPS